MPAPYSVDLRERLVRARDAGLTLAEIAHTLGVRPRTVQRWCARVRQGQSLAPKPIPGRPRQRSAADEALLIAQVAARPAATRPEQRAGWWNRMLDISADDLVFLDETSTQITMTRLRGRALRGVRLTDAVPRNHGDNLTLLAAIGTTG